MTTIHISGFGYLTESQVAEFIRQMFEYTSVCDSLRSIYNTTEGFTDEAVEKINRDRSCIQDFMVNRSRYLMRIADEQKKIFQIHKNIPNGQDTSNPLSHHS